MRNYTITCPEVLDNMSNYKLEMFALSHLGENVLLLELTEKYDRGNFWEFMMLSIALKMNLVSVETEHAKDLIQDNCNYLLNRLINSLGAGFILTEILLFLEDRNKDDLHSTLISIIKDYSNNTTIAKFERGN